MGGNASKNRGRGDVEDCINEYHSCVGGDGISDVAKISNPNGKRYSNDKALHARWEQYIEGTVDKQPSANLESCSKESLLNSRNSTDNITPSSRGDDQLSPSTVSTIPNLLPPKIRLQILSPVHSRVQLQNSQKNAQDLASRNQHRHIAGPIFIPGVSKTSGGLSSLLFIKKPCEKCPENSCQEIHTENLQPEQLGLYQNRLALHHPSFRKSKNQLTIKPSQGVSQNLKIKIPKEFNSKLNSQEHRPNVRPVITEAGTSQHVYNIRPVTRTLSKHSIKAAITKKPPTKITKLRRTSSHRLADGRQTTALSGLSSKKLKVKGLQNFVNTHKPCPPLWAKQFPCRSRFHPDNYLYDFEGFNAPKRPVTEMDKCSKKCGRCNRCGVYADNICQKCGNCKMDCKCPITTPLPTAEHFLSQIFGTDWTQTQKVEVNGHPVIPDKPRLNLHDASSNNPLKVSQNKAPEEPQKVMATGYDSYSPVPNPTPALPSYPTYPGYGYSYPGYVPWPTSYPPGYYPAYSPMPPPPPYYGCTQPPLIPSPYNYPVGPNKTDTNG